MPENSFPQIRENTLCCGIDKKNVALKSYLDKGVGVVNRQLSDFSDFLMGIPGTANVFVYPQTHKKDNRSNNQYRYRNKKAEKIGAHLFTPYDCGYNATGFPSQTAWR